MASLIDHTAKCQCLAHTYFSIQCGDACHAMRCGRAQDKQRHIQDSFSPVNTTPHRCIRIRFEHSGCSDERHLGVFPKYLQNHASAMVDPNTTANEPFPQYGQRRLTMPSPPCATTQFIGVSPPTWVRQALASVSTEIVCECGVGTDAGASCDPGQLRQCKEAHDTNFTNVPTQRPRTRPRCHVRVETQKGILGK